MVFVCGVGITRRVEHFVQALVDVTADLGLPTERLHTGWLSRPAARSG